MVGPAGERLVGREYASGELAGILNRQAEILRMNDGGVTFSGGEPLMQAAFVLDVMNRLDNIHVLLDTSGYADEDDFRMVVEKSDLVHFDLKLADPRAHARYTGKDNALILGNLRVLSEMGKPFIARIPLVPGITDTAENLTAIAGTIKGSKGLLRAELLPYNRAAGGKYRACGMEFRPNYDENRDVNANTGVFRKAGIEVKVC